MTHSAALISTEELARKLAAPGLRLFDCTTYLRPRTDGQPGYVSESGRANYKALERETGVTRASIMRFVRGSQSLRLDRADRLAAWDVRWLEEPVTSDDPDGLRTVRERTTIDVAAVAPLSRSLARI